MQATIITIGDEILIGQVIDTNSAWIGAQLNELGIQINEICSIQDERNAIISTLQRVVPNADLVFLTGGLGPTKDDITKKCIAEYLEVGMEFSQETYDRIIKLFESFGRQISSSHKEQSYMPQGAELIFNNMGTAPGMLFRKGKARIFSMPGVPYEMKYIMETGILPMIALGIKQQNKVYNRTIMTAGVGETQIEDLISPIAVKFPPGVSIAYLPSLGSVRVRITSIGLSPQKVDKLTEEVALILGEAVYGFDDITLSESLKNLCINKGVKLGLAESCTGGLMSHKITAVSGSSAYYMGSIVSYSNELKQEILGVQTATLINHGAVSEQTVIEMAKGALKVLSVDVAVSISGIAGPTGGTLQKPVGTIWICIANKHEHFAFKIQASKNRAKNIEYAVTIALNNLRTFVGRM